MNAVEKAMHAIREVEDTAPNAMAARERLLKVATEARYRADHVAILVLTDAEMRAQGDLCDCRGTDEYCPCQNAPTVRTLRARVSPNKEG